jgi:hypothetical protein
VRGLSQQLLQLPGVARYCYTVFAISSALDRLQTLHATTGQGQTRKQGYSKAMRPCVSAEKRARLRTKKNVLAILHVSMSNRRTRAA